MEARMVTAVTASFEKDGKRYYKFTIEKGQEEMAVGSIYVAKDAFEGKVPDKINIVIERPE